MSDTINSHEAAARRKKVNALAGWIVAAMGRMPDMNAYLSHAAAVRFCDRANDAAWEMAAREAGVRVPSETTKAQVRAQLVASRDALLVDPFASIGMTG